MTIPGNDSVPVPAAEIGASGPSPFASLPRHGLMYGFGILLSKLIAIIMLPVYTRFLTVADYGILQIITVTVEVISIVAGSRIAVGIFHYYHRAGTDAERRDVLSTAMVLLTLTYFSVTLMAVIAAPQLADLVFEGRGANVTYIRLGAAALAFEGLFLVPVAYLQLEKRSGLFVAVNLVKLLIQLTLNIVFLVVFKLGVLGVLLSGLIANVVIGGALAVWLAARVGLSLQRTLVRSFLRFGIPLMGMQAASLLVTFGDRFFLFRAGGEHPVGLYGLAYQFGFLLFTVGYQPLQRAWDPERFAIAKRDDRDELYARGWIYTNALLVTIAVGLALFSGDVIRIMAAPAFHPAAVYVPIIVLAQLLQVWAVFHNFGMLVTERTELFTLATWAAAAVALLGYLLVVPRWLALGAAVTAVASFGTRFALSYWFSQRLYPIRFRWRPVILQIAVAVAVCVAAALLPPVHVVVSMLIRGTLFLVYALLVWRFGGLSDADRAAAIGFVSSVPRKLSSLLGRRHAVVREGNAS